MAIITIVGAGMMGSALAFPARENGHEVRVVGTHLDRDIIEGCRKTKELLGKTHCVNEVAKVIKKELIGE